MSIEIKIRAICIATTHANTLRTLLASIESYIPPEVEVFIAYANEKPGCVSSQRKIRMLKTTAKSFGEAYNFIVNTAFTEHDAVIVCNDDIVFTPFTYSQLIDDTEFIVKRFGIQNIGWIATQCDYAIGLQNIRHIPPSYPDVNFTLNDIKHEREYYIRETEFVAPICGLVFKQNWTNYLPINYFSDNIQCHQMKNKGKRHFISRAYVHHVGSQSLLSSQEEIDKALSVLKNGYQQECEYIESILGKK
jgi:hypothetical protein